MISSAVLPQLQRGLSLHQAGRNAEAWMILAPLRQAIDREGQALRVYALVAQAAGRTDDAVSALERIITLESDPPDLVGALADVLGKAGRHEEALRYWDKLVARRPDLADAHLNRAVTAANAGRHELAIEAADEGLKRFPSHARLLAAKAMALKNAGRLSESLTLFEDAIEADPSRPLTRYNQAVALRAACRFEEACEAYASAERLGMQGAVFHSNWAAAALEAGRVEEAAKLYERALAEDPSHQESLKALSRLDIEYRGGGRAFDHYRVATEARGWPVAAIVDWANSLVGHKRLDEAHQVLAEGVKRHPESLMLQQAEIFTGGMAGDPGPALDRLEEALRAAPQDPMLQSSVQILAMRAKRFDRAAEMLEAEVARNPRNLVAWAQLSIAWRLLDDPREDWLCDYDRLVMVTDVPSPDGAADPEEYARAMSLVLDPLHVTSAEPGDQTLRKGTQTSGNLFARPEPEIQQFRTAVLEAAKTELAKLSPDPTHPFLSRLSPRLDFSGSWSVRLQPGGHHIPHYHPQGWMSSAYYARLPQTSPKAEERQEGWIQFGVPPAEYGVDLAPRRIVQPRPGRLVLFPSYMWHGTIPFHSHDRLTAAFDYQPI